MSMGYVIPVDPAELAARFSGDDESLRAWQLDELAADAYDDDVLDFEEFESHESRVLELLDRIPPREADLIDLHFFRKKRQADIAAIFEVTQAAISYRLARGIERIRFLLSIPDVEEADLRRDLREVLPQQIDVDILVGMWKSTCQSEVATSLGLTQGRVRHRFFKAVEVLRGQSDARYDPYRKIFTTIADKKYFNVLRAVVLPQWENRGLDTCM